jgi:hypothetical protein
MMMLNDEPAKSDPLGRRPFAESIAKVISIQSDPAPLVIAIDGEWGVGKTTVLGFLTEVLKSKGLDVLDFNPWRYKEEELMIRGFIISLGNTLGCEILNRRDHAVEWAQGKLDWVKEGSDVIGHGGIGRFFQFGAKRLRPTLEILTDRLIGHLNVKSKRVTVLVDDPDRLDADQLMGLFRLIKLTANFEWLTFVLAMDCDAVARTVGRRFGSEEEGKRFLEKIVQVPLRLPSVPHAKMLQFTLDLVQQVLYDLGIDPTESEVQRFRGVFDKGLMPFIGTPRLAKQYANALRFALGFTSGEVNPVDVMLLEGLRLLLPNTFIRLIEHVAPAGDKIVDDILDSNKRSGSEPDIFSQILPNVELKSSKRALKELLTTLFPHFLKNSNYHQETYHRWAWDKRVAVEDYLWRYLHCAVPDYDVPDAEFDELLRVAESGDQGEVTVLVRNVIESKRSKIGVDKFRRIEERLSSRQRKALAVGIAENVDALTFHDLAWQFEVPFGQAAIAASHFVRDFMPMDLREQLAIEVIVKSRSTLWAREFCSWLPHIRDEKDMDANQRKLVFDGETSDRIHKILAQRIMKDLEEYPGLPPLELLRDFRICAKYGQNNEFRDWARSMVVRDIDFMLHLGCALMSWSYGVDGRTFCWPGDDSALKLLETCLGLDWFRQNVACDPSSARETYGRGLTPHEILFRLVEIANRKKTDAEGEKTGDLPTPNVLQRE